jgi:glycosyltransferase involved in cell wall biosynthesis
METVVTLSRALAQVPGIDVHVVSRSTRLPETRRESFGNLHVTWVQDPLPRVDHLIGRSILRKRLEKELVAIRPDVVHAHGEAPFIRSAIDSGIPAVITLQSIFAYQTRAHTRRAPLSFLAAYALMRRWEARYIPRIVNLVAVNRVIAEYVKARSPRAEITFIKNPVDAEFFSVCDLETTPTILFVGQISRRKGLHLLFEAFARIAEAHPTCRLRIVGDRLQDAPYAAGLERQYAPFIASGRVTFVGPASRSHVRRELAQCSLLCLPSYYEASPVVVIEAMAAAKPVVATRVGDVDDLLGDRNAGLVVDQANVDQLARALDEMLIDATSRRAMGARARQAARRRASPEVIAAQTLDVYRMAIERARCQANGSAA